MNTAELRHILRIAVPVIFAQVGQIMLGVVDTFMLKEIGTIPQGGVGAGNSFFWTTCIVGIGILYSLDTLISQAKGRGDSHACLEYLVQGLWLATIISAIMVPFVFWVMHYYDLVGTTPDLLPYIKEYLSITAWSCPFIFLYIVFARYWQALESVIPLAVLMLAANVFHYYANRLCMHGYDGWFTLPAMGARGVAIATLGTRVMLLVAVVAFTLWKFRGRFGEWRSVSWRPHGLHLRRLLALGLPSGGQVALEVYAFSGTTALATRLGAQAAASHQIVLTMASFAFMFPMGLSAAAAIRVGTLLGQGEPQRAKRAGSIAIWLSVLVMSVSSLAMFGFPRILLGWFTQDAQVLALASQVLIFAALFQIFDGVQVTTTGALRGLGDTKTALFANFIGYYPIGLAAGVFLCFGRNFGLVGLWMGLALGLWVVASLLTWTWIRRRPLLIT
ncbi:MAG: MATE family efflux transporter [Bacteriovoracia bacterium]